jgi:hypothetical protein
MSNSWDNGYPSGGNYWSDHSNVDEANGVDQNVTGSDGIVDVNYQDLDEYPLSAPVSFFVLCRSGQRDYYARVASNFTVSSFQFTPSIASVVLNVSGNGGGNGFCRVSLPKDVVWVESGEFWTIVANETLPLDDALIMDDVDSTYFYAGFDGGTQNLRITGTHAVPEFSLLAVVIFALCLISLVNLAEKSCLRKLGKQFAKG